MDDFAPVRLKDVTLECVFHALGDQMRLRIFCKLLREGEMSCKSICDHTPKSTLSHHFRVMRLCGLLKTRFVGTARMISVPEAELNARFPGLIPLILEEYQDLARSRGLEPPTLSSAS